MNNNDFLDTLTAQICGILETALAEVKKWEFRAESAKEVIETLVERFNIPDEAFCGVVMDVLERRKAAEKKTAPNFVD